LDIEGMIMKISATISWSVVRNGLAFTAALLFGMVFHIDAQALTINVVDPNGVPVADFRWLVEEDATKDVDFTPAQPGRDLSLSFHTSYMPVAGKGDSATSTSIALDPTKRYFVSVLPVGW